MHREISNDVENFKYNLAVIKIAVDSATSDTSYYYEVVNEEDRQQVWARIEGMPAEAQDKALLAVGQNMDMLNSLVFNTRAVSPTTTFAIDADKRLRFKWIFDAMEILRKNRATLFNYVTEKRQ